MRINCLKKKINKGRRKRKEEQKALFKLMQGFTKRLPAAWRRSGVSRLWLSLSCWSVSSRCCSAVASSWPSAQYNSCRFTLWNIVVQWQNIEPVPTLNGVGLVQREKISFAHTKPQNLLFFFKCLTFLSCHTDKQLQKLLYQLENQQKKYIFQLKGKYRLLFVSNAGRKQQSGCERGGGGEGLWKGTAA